MQLARHANVYDRYRDVSEIRQCLQISSSGLQSNTLASPTSAESCPCILGRDLYTGKASSE